MLVSLKDLCRDIAFIVVPTYLVAAIFVFSGTDVPAGTYRAIDLLVIWTGAGAAGWLFCRKHGYLGLFDLVRGNPARRQLLVQHSALFATASTLIIATVNISLAPEDYKLLASPSATKVLIVIVPLALLMSWGKVFMAMQLGQWLCHKSRKDSL